MRCLFSNRAIPTPSFSPTPFRPFSSTPRVARRSRYPSHYPPISPSELEERTEAWNQTIDERAKNFRPYTEEERAALREIYTPEQIEAIEAGEAAIDAKDLAIQARLRSDPWRLQYLDDLSKIDPIIDKKPPGYEPPKDVKGLDKLLGGRSSVSSEETDPHLLRLMQQTGYTQEQIRRFRVKNLVSHRVVNQTRMGKIQSLYYLTIAGNQNGLLGIGEGKSAEDEDARRQAMMNAIRNMKPIQRYENRTIYGQVQGKVGATEVELSSRGPGIESFCRRSIHD